MPPATIAMTAPFPTESDAPISSEGDAQKPYEQLSLWTNGFYNKYKDFSPEFCTPVDPLPLPPSHGDNIVSPFTAVERKIPGMQVASLDSLKRNHEVLMKEISSSIQYQGFKMPFNQTFGDVNETRPNKRIRQLSDESISHSQQNHAAEKICEESPPTVAGKRSVPMAMKCDEDYLSDYQCLIRQQIEIFEATEEDVLSRDRGRNTAIHIGQVGIRCKHCASIPAMFRFRGSSYYTSTLKGLYQAAQKMTTNHFSNNCLLIPYSVKESLMELKNDRRRAPGGKGYWAEGARILGVRETDGKGLRFENAEEATEESPTTQE